MANFAEIGANNTVVRVISIHDEYETYGEEYIRNSMGLSGRWIQTSFHTYAGQHIQGGTPLRMNYAAPDFTYDEKRDAFIPPQPFPSWTLNEETCLWDSPVPYPQGNVQYQWSEQELQWIEVHA